MSDAFMTNEPLGETETKFEELVGEGKRYRDPDAAAKAIVEKDSFIEQLKREAAEMRTSLQKREQEAAFLDRLEALSRAKSPELGNPPPEDGTPNATAVTPEVVEQVIVAREAKKLAQTNLDTTVRKLQEVYGDDYKRHVAATARQIGMSTSDLTELASRSPEAFFRTVGLGQVQKKDAFDAPPRSAVSLSPNSRGEVKNYAYYAKIRAEKGEAAYFQPSVQNEMWSNLKTLGEEEFYK